MPLIVNGILITAIIIDFKLIWKSGTVEFVEVKGYATPEWKLKWKLFEALHPEALTRVV